MKKMVNGVEVTCTPEEEAEILARWAAADAARTASDAADAERAARKVALDAESVSDQFIDQLRGATPAQIKTFVQNNVTDLASARALLGRLAVAVAYVLNGGTPK
jgi:hypothetical protein